MAKTKAAGASRYGKNPIAKRLGVKKFDGQKVLAGSILIRQRGTKFLAGKNCAYGKDWTIYSLKNGVIKFSTKIKKNFDNSSRPVKVINVIEESIFLAK